MPRKKFVAQNLYPYHVDARCHNKQWFTLSMDEIWNIFSVYLYFIHHAFNVRIHSFVLMSNHFHLIISTPDKNLDKAMNYFMRETSKIISFESGRINQVFGGPYYRSIIKDDRHYRCVYKYVYLNPVEAGIVNRAEDYRYSTLHPLLGRSFTHIPVHEDKFLFERVDQKLTWINKSFPRQTDRQDITHGLRHPEFKLPLDKNRNPHPLDMETD